MLVVVRCTHCGSELQEADVPRVGPGTQCTRCGKFMDLAALGIQPILDPLAIADASGVDRSQGLDPEKDYHLVVLDGNDPGALYLFDKPRLVIGRQGSDVVLDDPEISRNHAAVTVHGPHGILEDLRSTNGTYIQGQRVAQAKLDNQTDFRVGTHQLVFLATSRA